MIDSAYIIGLNSAVTETRLAETAFPAACPYGIAQVLDPNFYPGRP